MPIFTINTNLPSVGKDAMMGLNKDLQEISGRNAKNNIVTVLTGLDMVNGDSVDAPCATATYVISPNLQATDSPSVVMPKLFKTVEKHLGIPKNKFFVVIEETAIDKLGIDGDCAKPQK